METGTAVSVIERAQVALGAGYCRCGCGQKTPLAKGTDGRFGLIKGEPVKFIHGHAVAGAGNGRWRGGSYVRKDGYVACLKKDHPRASSIGGVLEHVLIAEAALGKVLPPKAVIHHTDEQHGTVDPLGIVICPDDAYHKLLHIRSRALRESGNANWRKCWVCKRYDDPRNLRINKAHVYHQECNKLRQRKQKEML